MTGLVGALRVVLGANTAQYEAGMQRASRTARTTGNDISRSLASAQRTAVAAFRGIAAAAGVVGLVGAARVFAGYVDAAKNLEAQLRLATRESGNFAQAQQDVRAIAQSSRSDISAVAELYATLQRNSRELNITQTESARITETITKAFQISGATAAEAAGGLRQFLQGLQSGTLRGEELNSVLENAPRLARALADGLGVTIGQLRAMGQEGELTGEKVTQAILGASQSIDEEFRQLPVTFDQAMTQITNAATVAFGAFDRGGEFSEALINFAGTGEMSFGQIEAAAFDTGREIRAIMAGLSDVFMPMGAGASNIFDMIRNEAAGLANAIADILNTAQGVANTIQNIAGARFDLRSMSMVYPEQANFGDRFTQNLRTSRNDAGLLGAWAFQTGGNGAGGGGAPSRPTISGGGGGSRRRSGGGGGGRARAARPLTRTGDLEDFVSPWVEGRSIAEMEQDARDLRAGLGDTQAMLEEISAIPLPDLGNMLTREDREELESFTDSFTRDLTDGLAQAIVYGKDLGDALLSTIQRAASELLSSGLMQLLNGGGQGGGGGILGTIVQSIVASVGGTPGGAGGSSVVGMATGGSFTVGGRTGIDRNVLSINGSPVARVSHGETVGVSPNGGGGGKVEIILRDEMLDARIASGAGIAIIQSHPALKADTLRSINEQGRRR